MTLLLIENGDLIDSLRYNLSHELIRYCSHIYVLCVSSHFWPFTKANLVLENFNKTLGFGPTPPPPCWAKSPSFSEN